MRKSLLAAFGAVALTGVVSAGDVWTWTGAKDSYWTNAANWTVGGAVATVPPGCYFGTDGQRTGATDSTASFGSLASEEATVDVSGVFDVYALVVTANTTTKYTFGPSGQRFAIHATGGVFRVEAGAKAPLVAADFGAAARAQSSGVQNWNVGSTEAVEGKADFMSTAPVIENNSSEELVFQKFWDARTAYYTYHNIVFKGTGDIRLAGLANAVAAWAGRYQVVSLQQSGSRLILDYNVPSTYGLHAFRSHRKHPAIVEIATNRTWNTNAGTDFVAVGREGGSMTICGEGTLNYTACKKRDTQKDPDTFVSSNVLVPYGSSLKIDVRQTSTYYTAPDFYANLYAFYYPGGITLTGKNESRGLIRIVANEAKTLSVTSIGLGKETNSCLGYSDLLFGGGAILRYGGAGETCDRTLFITNGSPRAYNENPDAVSAAATIRHAGSGDLVWNGPVRAPGVAASAKPTVTFDVDGSSRTMSFGGALDAHLSLAKTGEGTLRITTNLTNAGATTVSAGTLAVAPTAALSVLSPLTVTATARILFEGDGTERTTAISNLTQTAGTTTLAVQDGTSLVVSNLSYAAGSVKIVRSGASEVHILDPVLVGTTPAWLTYNGLAARIDSDGTVIPTAYANVIAARGDEVPDLPDGEVTIFKIGTTGPDTLAKAAVAMKTLRQAAPVAADVSLAESETVTADVVSMTSDADALRVGLVPGRGTLAPSGDVLQLANAHATNGISVAAKVGAKQIDARSSGAVNEFSGGLDETNLRVPRGALRLTGEKTIALTSLFVGTNVTLGAALTPTLRIENAPDVRLGTGSVFAVGATYTGDPFITGKSPGSDANWSCDNARLGRMIVSNATLAAPKTDASAFTGSSCRDAICVGHTGWGILEIEPETVITGRLAVGCGAFANKKASYGCLYQRGGSVTVWSRSNKDQPGFNVGFRAGSGYYHLSAGSLTVLNGDMSVGQLALGVFAMDGGTVSVSGCLRFANSNGGVGFMRLSGGTFKSDSTDFVNASAGGFGNLLVENGAVARLGGVNGAFGASEGYLCDASLNLNSGGVLEADGFQLGKTLGNTRFSIGFNGGTFRCTKPMRDIFYRQYAYSTTQYPTNVYVYAGGATIDTGTNTVGAGAVLRAPTGLGVASVGFDAPFESHSEPLVRIVGDGYGATAVAEFDLATKRVTGVRVTSAGSGYTSATAKLSVYSTGAYVKTYDCTLGAVASGGLTKIGSGTLTLTAANTYTGATHVAEGTLTAGANNVIKAGSALEISGGATVNFNGMTASVGKLVYSAGGGKVTNASNVTGLDNLELRISTEEIAAGGPLALAGDIDLAGQTLVLTGDVTALDPDRFHTVATTTGSFSGRPAVSPKLPGDWTLGVRGGKLTLHRRKGFGFYIVSR